ncbi:hypothetical protein BDV93DRAFT_492021 [Ceratobasidium sp. AG-I]|nr:hypothetical protein BDV93DRAFT_492021 [Ceratobasidium sp. AG-I]
MISRGQKRVKGPHWLQIPLANLPVLGTQFVWSAEMAFVSPYLLEFGLTRAHMALVMLAAPVSGLLVQPVIGSLADNSTSKWGRRRPYMLSGSVLCALSLMMLSYARELSAWMSGKDEHDSVGLTQAIAVVAVYLIDFTLNATTAASRALAIDVLPIESQAASGAWVSRLIGAGGIIGFYTGKSALPRIFPALGNLQIAILSFFAAGSLLVTQFATTACVSESVHTSTPTSAPKLALNGISFSQKWVEVTQIIRGIPRDVKAICAIQFFSWMGWFPLMFFGTVWVGDVYVREALRLGDSRAETDPSLRADGTRAGSRAMLYGALLAFAISIVLPYFVKDSESGSPEARGGATNRSTLVRAKLSISLRSWWTFSHALFGLLLLATGWVATVRGAFVIFTLQGLCSVISHWAAFTIIATAAHKDSFGEYLPLAQQHPGDDDEVEQEGYPLQHLHSSGRELEVNEDPKRAGFFLGISNIFIVLPQFVCISISAIIFSILEPGRSILGGSPAPTSSDEKSNSLTIILMIGGMSSFIACFLTKKLLK